MISHPNVKINIGLNVLRRRDDGYHDIETLFFPYFEICDTLEIISGDDYSRTSAEIFSKYSENETVQGISPDGKLMITIARRGGVDWDPLKDLTAKAYFALAGDFGLPAVKIYLEKLAPVGAGLGGGSSDAAFALKMLNDIFALGLDDDTLAGYASKLGSDCAFFVYNRPMIGEGRGEILSEYPMPVSEEEIRRGFIAKNCRVKVIVPESISVSTAEAYRGITPELPTTSLKEALAKPIETWKDFLYNDFERSVFSAHPELAKIKQSLYDSGAVYASMSGSGSAMFGIY